MAQAMVCGVRGFSCVCVLPPSVVQIMPMTGGSARPPSSTCNASMSQSVVLMVRNSGSIIQRYR